MAQRPLTNMKRFLIWLFIQITAAGAIMGGVNAKMIGETVSDGVLTGIVFPLVSILTYLK